MSRTKNEIKKAIISEMQTLIPELTSISATAIYKLLADVFASATATFEEVSEVELAAIEAIVRNNQYGTTPQLIVQAFAYQDGDTLEWDSETGTFKYPEGSTGEKIIARVAVSEDAPSGDFIVKCAKEDGGVLVGLSVAEKGRFENYLIRVTPVGYSFQVVSDPADVLAAAGTIFYQGQRPEGDIKADLQTALDEFRSDLTSVEQFSGAFSVNEFIDKIRDVEGIEDVSFTYRRHRGRKLPCGRCREWGYTPRDRGYL